MPRLCIVMVVEFLTWRESMPDRIVMICERLTNGDKKEADWLVNHYHRELNKRGDIYNPEAFLLTALEFRRDRQRRFGRAVEEKSPHEPTPEMQADFEYNKLLALRVKDYFDHQDERTGMINYKAGRSMSVGDALFWVKWKDTPGGVAHSHGTALAQPRAEFVKKMNAMWRRAGFQRRDEDDRGMGEQNHLQYRPEHMGALEGEEAAQ